MHTYSHTSNTPIQTEGRLIRWASYYDLTVNLMTFGQAGRFRWMTLDQAMLQTGEALLDVGCGTGGLTIPARIRLGEHGSAAGIDPAPEMIDVAQRKAKHARLEIDFRLGAIEDLPFPDNSFDVVTSSLMMHHLPENLRIQGLAEIRRVLKPGGRVLIADMKRPGGSFIERAVRSHVLHHGHVVQFGIEDMPGLLNEAGFEEIEQTGAHFWIIGFARAKKPAS